MKDSLKALACAVLEGALKDIKNTRVNNSDKTFPTEEGEAALIFWCELADISPWIIRRTAKNLMDGKKKSAHAENTST